MCVHPTAHVFCPFWHFLLFLVALLFRWAECDIYSANVALRRRIVCQTSRLSYFFFFTKYCVIGWVGFFSVHTIKLDISHRYEQIGHPCAVAGATGNTVMQMSGSLPHSSSPLLTIISPRGQCDFLSFESSLSPLTFWLLLISSSYVRKGVRRRGGGGRVCELCETSPSLVAQFFGKMYKQTFNFPFGFLRCTKHPPPSHDAPLPLQSAMCWLVQ